MTVRAKPALILVAVAVLLLGPALYVYWARIVTFGSAPPPRTAAQASSAPSGPSGDQRTLEALRAVALSTAPFTSLPLIMPPSESPLGESFRELIVLPPGKAEDPPPIDARTLRALMDRGVVTYASAAARAAGDAQRQQGAELIQTAALLGFPPARALVVRNYPQSEPMRRAVTAPDVIRYATAYLATPIIPPDSKAQFEALAAHFATSGQIDLFIAQLLEGLREDRRPQLSHRIDTLFDLLGNVSGACRALARALSVDPTPDECTRPVAEALRRHIENSKPLDREAESKRRGFARLVPSGAR